MMVLLSLALLSGCNGGETPASSSFNKTAKIKAYTRDTTSGTRDGFMTRIGLEKAKESNDPLKTTVEEVTSNGDMIAKLKADEYGIGYFSFSSKADAENEGVKAVTYKGVEATEDSIIDGTYQLSRNFNYCTRIETDATKKLIVDAFVAYMSTSDGIQDIVAGGGVVKATKDTKSWDEIKDNYKGISDDHSNITIVFGGSTSCLEVSTKLTDSFTKKAGNFIAEHDHHGSGDAYKYTQDPTNSKDSSHKQYDVAFASREFKTSEALAEGTYGKICTDGILVGVNNKNPLTNITGEQAVGIYSKDGNVNTWADLLG